MSAAKKSVDLFDVKKVRQLIELMEEHDLAEIDLRQGDHGVRIKRGGEVVAVSAATSAAPRAPAAA
ncbi:MAG: acetyl-CoA carboxylase, biotin carboxyl carrier protein, partial [Planctomycetia bacterium]